VSAGDGEHTVWLAQQLDLPYLNVAPTFVAESGSEAPLPIRVSPPEALPQRSFLSLRGLPPTVGLTEGHSVGVGSWAVPLAVLAKTKVIIPEGLSARAEVVVSLIGMDGKLIAQARTTFVVGPAPAAKPTDNTVKETGPVALPAPKEEPKAGPSGVLRPVDITAQERARAEDLVAQGDRYIVQGKVASARLFFRQAADANLALGAMRLAATYDPAELSALKVLGVGPDLAEARKWYERARELGAPEAEQRLANLPRN
jgi:hypothetical protein